jgi:alkyl sulfatase
MTTLTSLNTIEIRPTSGYIGAEIYGADLRRPFEPEEFAQLSDALARWKVLFFRHQDIDKEQLVQFGGQFGEVNPCHPIIPPKIEGFPEIMSNDNRERREDRKLEGREYDDGNRFHQDASFVVNPARYSILHGVLIPPYGGDTVFTNLAAAYADLSQPIKELADQLRVVHINVVHNNGKRDRNVQLKNDFEAPYYETIHPLVQVLPETGERVLAINAGFVRWIEGLRPHESVALIDFFLKQITSPDFTVRYRWGQGDVVLWDNHSVAHIAPTDMRALEFDRVLNRILLLGHIPVGVDGRRSESVAGKPFNWEVSGIDRVR